MRENLSGLSGLIDVAKKTDSELFFINLIAFDEELDKQHVSNVEEYYKRYKEVLLEARGRHVPVFIRPPYPKRNECTGPWITPVISIAGDIYPCCYIYEGRGGVPTFPEYLKGVRIEVPMYQYCMGNIFQRTLAEIWNGEEYMSLRRKIIMTNSMNFASYEELNGLRKTIDLTEKYEYCKICLHRYSCAC